MKHDAYMKSETCYFYGYTGFGYEYLSPATRLFETRAIPKKEHAILKLY